MAKFVSLSFLLNSEVYTYRGPLRIFYCPVNVIFGMKPIKRWFKSKWVWLW